ncbi:3-isopropylmalate dehydratase large subunit [Temperatibacter marinus]|uniref:3-isopropylmalate dehydratase large subunit n=1 Tax=Temperatibacter marinus TaxID=1456591 RepID=A0AA52EH28_9PROT|nr:3-isopropylmalate dehydratase large subunit [Temperatibacter marinus]WND03538.1 3-isopropylmalate dehydratase large subunit [Temperatibacter marinus]
MAQTLYDKIWSAHLVDEEKDGSCLLYIDRHIIHEVTSAQAFEGLKQAGLSVWRKGSILATPDHQVPTTGRGLGLEGIEDTIAREQVITLDQNCRTNDIRHFSLNDHRQGIVHVVGPEQGATLPGMTVVCGDSHTSTHGAFAALAQGIGTTEVEHVLATQTLSQKKAKTMLVQVDGALKPGVTAKDLALYIIGQIGLAGGTGYAIEYSGSAIRSLSMEGRMTLCNMSIEAGARTGMVAFDQITEAYLKDKPFSPKGALWSKAVSHWKTLKSDSDSQFDKAYFIDACDIEPHVTWGTKPEQVLPISGLIPDPENETDSVKRADYTRALTYMGLKKNRSLMHTPIDRVFIGSCTNGRIEDIRAVAHFVKNRRIAPSIKEALVVPGSGLVKALAESEGLDVILKEAGFQWRFAGCSMCNAMNPDHLLPEERCASTSNRNFEGRQGPKGRTHLMSPVMAAAAAITGKITDSRLLEERE